MIVPPQANKQSPADRLMIKPSAVTLFITTHTKYIHKEDATPKVQIANNTCFPPKSNTIRKAKLQVNPNKDARF